MPKGIKAVKNNKGFTLVELIVTIGIIFVLLAVFTPRVVQYIDYANKNTSLANAKLMCNTAQMAIMSAQSEERASFEFSTKYSVKLNSSDSVQAKVKEKFGDTIKVGRFTNKSLYQYVNGVTSNNKSAKADMTIAKEIVNILATNEYNVDCNPIDNRDSTKYISDHRDEYGKFAFAFCYNEKGEIVYFESTYAGYFVKIIAGETTVEKVSDDTYFCDWPKKSQRIDPSW